MTASTIHYIASANKKKTTIEVLHTYFSKQGIELIAYDFQGEDTPRYLMIIEPLQIKTEFYSISRIWKRWLFNHSMDTRLFVAGYSDSKHPNYLNLLALPLSLDSWLDELYPVGAYPLQYAGTDKLANGFQVDRYVDPWDRFLPVRGMDITKQLCKFLDGHDEQYSFNNQLSRIRKELIDLRSLLGEQEKDEGMILQKKDTVWQEWSYLKKRWHFYEPLFKWLPFKETAKAIKESIGKGSRLDEWFASTNQLPSAPQLEKISDVIEKVIQEVKDKIDRNVYPENYW